MYQVSIYLYGVANCKIVGGLRNVTRAEVASRFMVPESTISTWKACLGTILTTRKHDRRTPADPVCAYPEMEKALFERFWKRRQEGKIVRRGWIRAAARWFFTQEY